jgi:hypothetical protein
MEEQALTTIERPMEALSISREPGLVLEEARRAATALKQVIDGKKKKLTFHGETYLSNEDWLTVARFYGVTSRIRSAKYIEFGEGDSKVAGFESVAEAFLVGSETVISTAESMCLNDEPNWSKKPLFQLKSMAQTRASSRVLRQVFGWVVVLAGYQPTPAEEMPLEAIGEDDQSYKAEYEKRTADQARNINAAEAKVFLAACNKGGKTKEQVQARFKLLKISRLSQMHYSDYEAELKWATLKKSVEAAGHNFKKLFGKAKERGIPEEDVRRVGHEVYKVHSLTELTPEQFEGLVEWVDSQVSA